MPLATLIGERWKDRLHIIQIVLITLAIALSFGRLAINNPPASRANVIYVTMVRLLSIIDCSAQWVTAVSVSFNVS